MPSFTSLDCITTWLFYMWYLKILKSLFLKVWFWCLFSIGSCLWWLSFFPYVLWFQNLSVEILWSLGLKCFSLQIGFLLPSTRKHNQSSSTSDQIFYMSQRECDTHPQTHVMAGLKLGIFWRVVFSPFHPELSQKQTVFHLPLWGGLFSNVLTRELALFKGLWSDLYPQTQPLSTHPCISVTHHDKCPQAKASSNINLPF